MHNLNARSKTKLDIKGQVSIMIAMMMMTFILFFAFVINIGMLVNAKINLQNAADLAAYSGAAQQARLLNEISYLNYEMRRQYKKFLFRYYVIGNMNQKEFPRGGGSGPMKWSPEGKTDYQVPAVCYITKQVDNFCQLYVQPKIQQVPKSPMDMINATLDNQFGQIERLRQDDCRAIGVTNQLLLSYWLYNTDPNFSNSNLEGNTDPEVKRVTDIIKGMSFGLGLIPRELILKSRLDTLQQYINAPSQKGLTKEKVDSLAQTADPTFKERSIDAFYSAYHTLGNHTFFDDGAITLDELLPGTTEQANLLLLKPVVIRFDAYAVNFALADPNSKGTEPQDCTAQLIPFSLIKPGMTVAVYKDPSVLTYYAIRLKATAKVLFSPFGDVELTAYSAAKPFGSRIGPSIDYKSFLRQDVQGSEAYLPDGSKSWDRAGSIPNLAIKKGDSTESGHGWDTQDVVGSMYSSILPKEEGDAKVVTPDDLFRGYHAAMVPNPIEGNLYNIMNDITKDPAELRTVRFFDTNCSTAFYAPIVPAGTSDIATKLKNELIKMYANPPSQMPPVLDKLANGLAKYVGDLQSGTVKGEGAGGNSSDPGTYEGFNIVRLDDALRSRPDSSGKCGPMSVGTDIMIDVSDSAALRSSWSAVPGGTVKDGRVGYSVKFVSFDSLTSHKTTTNGNDTWSNDLGTDSEADSAIPFLKH